MIALSFVMSCEKDDKDDDAPGEPLPYAIQYLSVTWLIPGKFYGVRMVLSG
jgi:hypothetical protein